MRMIQSRRSPRLADVEYELQLLAPVTPGHLFAYKTRDAKARRSARTQGEDVLRPIASCKWHQPCVQDVKLDRTTSRLLLPAASSNCLSHVLQVINVLIEARMSLLDCHAESLCESCTIQLKADRHSAFRGLFAARRPDQELISTAQ